MVLRAGHGTGRGRPHVEVLPANEQPSANPAPTVRRERDALGRFLPGNTVARSKRIRPGTGALRGAAGLAVCSAEFRPFARWGVRYGAHRRRELADAHGGNISAGVGALVESVALTMAASRFLQHTAAQSGDVDLFKQASQLAATARQHELAAWELASREAVVRRSGGPSPLAAIEARAAELLAKRKGRRETT